MNDDYDGGTALHYATFRPPLHLPILTGCLDQKINFGNGLDVGCGTGHSSWALAHFCDQVICVEPSMEMLKKALPHPKVQYRTSLANYKNYDADFFDIITFAGSLFYAKSQALLDEICRIGKIGCPVVVYDFEIMLDDNLKKLQIKTEERDTYDHQADFSGLKTDQLLLIKKGADKTAIKVNTSELSHLILSVKKYRDYLKDQYPESNPMTKIMELLRHFSGLDSFTLDVNLFYSVYQLEK